jgi:hypothetical protein
MVSRTFDTPRKMRRKGALPEHLSAFADRLDLAGQNIGHAAAPQIQS